MANSVLNIDEEYEEDNSGYEDNDHDLDDEEYEEDDHDLSYEDEGQIDVMSEYNSNGEQLLSDEEIKELEEENYKEDESNKMKLLFIFLLVLLAQFLVDVVAIIKYLN